MRPRSRRSDPNPSEAANRREPQTARAEIDSLVAELETAEAYAQRLRQLIADARDHLAAGRTSMALSLLNSALSDFDAATDVVAPSRGRA
jgi:hypothetical protein